MIIKFDFLKPVSFSSGFVSLPSTPQLFLEDQMTDDFNRAWPYATSFVLFIVFLAYCKKSSGLKRKCKLPPGRRSWPIIGDSIGWYNAVASSHPPHFVEQQVERYLMQFIHKMLQPFHENLHVSCNLSQILLHRVHSC